MQKYKHKITGKTCIEKDTFYYIDSEGNLPKWVVENSGDWEKVEKKKYEILSYECLGSDGSSCKDRQIFVKQPSGEYKWYNMYYSEKLINTELWNNEIGGFVIYSIKRLSDGEIFTVGDLVEHFIDSRDKGVIEKFNIVNGTMIAYFRGKNYHTDSTDSFLYWNNIDVIKHSKKPLFITEDGKEAFEGDKMFYVDIDEDEYPHSWKPQATTINSRQTFKGRISGDLYLFSTKEAAEKYIDENKPKYSKKDVLGIVSKSSSGTVVGGSTIINYGFLQSYLKNDKTK